MPIAVKDWLTTETLMTDDANRSKQSEPPWPRRDDRPDRRVERLEETHHRRLHEAVSRSDDDDAVEATRDAHR